MYRDRADGGRPQEGDTGLNRREFSAAACVSISAVLAGCSALEDDSESVDDGDENETDSDAADGENGTESDAENQTETDGDEQELIQDESVSGTIILSDDAEDHVEVVRDAFTWIDESPSDQCQVHVMVENASGAELRLDVEARIYDEDGAELASSAETDVEGPEPGEDDAVYSLDLDDCEGTAAYEFEITGVDADEDDEPSEPAEQDDDGFDDEDEPDDDDEPDEPDEPDESDDDSDEQDDDSFGDDDDDEQDDGDSDDDQEDDGEDEDDDDGDDGEEQDGDDDEEQATNILRVIVQDGDGDPIDHATVTVDEGGFAGWSETQTVDDQGRAEFEVEPGEYDVTVTADDYPTLEETVDVEVNLQYTVTLHRNS